ncbi:MAG: hypothetical protein WBP33_12465 [Saprospiraceae bacterium]|nr:hypothetical protein [Candidatus Vicinibacter proximus]MCC6843555.1 hypothetical protein [Saprospiraceae bacterium]
MIKRIKNWLGIEGPKIKFQKEVLNDDKQLIGSLSISTINPSTILNVQIVLKEKYNSGRSRHSRNQEFILGEMYINEPFHLGANEQIIIPYSLNYEKVKSGLDKIEDKNLMLKPLTGVIRMIRGTQSTYFLEVLAEIKDSMVPAVDIQVLEKLK